MGFCPDGVDGVYKLAESRLPDLSSFVPSRVWPWVVGDYPGARGFGPGRGALVEVSGEGTGQCLYHKRLEGGRFAYLWEGRRGKRWNSR